MKRDFDLIRAVLSAIEENEEATGHGFIHLHIKGRSSEEVSYHVKLLHDARLIEAVDLSTLTSFRWEPVTLTWYGHEFLDSSRNENIWAQVKKRAEKIEGISFQVLQEMLNEMVRYSVAT